MSKIFTIILGIASLLGVLPHATEKGIYLIGYLFGGALVGITIGIFFDWIWGKTKSKLTKTILVISAIILAGGSLGNIQPLMSKASLKNSYSKEFQSKPNEAISFLSAIFSSFEPSFKEAKKINLGQELDKIEKQLNKEDATTQTYFEELEKLNNIHQKISLWINDFDKKDTERFYNFFDHIFLTLKNTYEDSSDTLEQICDTELIKNTITSLAYSKEQLEIFKKFMELGVEKFTIYAMDKYPTKEELRRHVKIISNNNSINCLHKMINTKFFIPMAEELIKELAQIIQSADKTKINFDLEKYMKTTFNSLKNSPEGQKKIILDIQKLKDEFSLITETAVMAVYFK